MWIMWLSVYVQYLPNLILHIHIESKAWCRALWREKSSNITLAKWREKSNNIILAKWWVSVVPHSYRSLGESICMYMWMFVLGVLCVKMMCCGDMRNGEIIHNGCWDNVIVEIIFFWCLLNVHAFPYVDVIDGFLTPFLLLYLWRLYPWGTDT
jgi:hypothetical protein